MSCLTQLEPAQSLQVSQNRVSRIESGNMEHFQVALFRKCVEAVGGHLRIVVEIGDQRIRIA